MPPQPLVGRTAPELGPNTAFVLAICGVCFIYLELLRPGRIFPGVLGGAALVEAGYFLWRNSPSALGLALIGGAAALFLIEVFVPVYGMAGLFGTAALAAGVSKLFPQPPRILPAIGIPLSIVFGALTTFLAYTANRARRNKWSDIEQ